MGGLDFPKTQGNFALKQLTIIRKIFETNYVFHVKELTTGKLQFLFFKIFLLVLTKFSFREEDLAPGDYLMKFRDFPDIS